MINVNNFSENAFILRIVFTHRSSSSIDRLSPFIDTFRPFLSAFNGDESYKSWWMVKDDEEWLGDKL